ncbi:MAG: Latency-associated nuclear antigen [Candidatus Moranbacteria bacterium GW2011_GWE1_49_15]|nr:MAG: Latency-associated nuclear antigen [Candidatus Moranbacteria bacterium GW2011_GWE2_47_10]KKW07096.1 MAG: Latency-associated nuclear antigen [Candidatus Moranbacteria bacterium GW2011_GWE1_49_15]
MANGATEILKKSHKLYADLEDVLGWVNELAEGEKLPSEFCFMLLGLFNEMVDKRKIPAALEESVRKFGDDVLGLILHIEEAGKTEEGVPPPQEADVVAAPEKPEDPVKEDTPAPPPEAEEGPAPQAVVEAEEDLEPAREMKAPPKTEKTAVPVRNGQKNPVPTDPEDPIMHLQKRPSEPAEIRSLLSFPYEKTRLKSFVDILAYREHALNTRTWENSSREVIRLREKGQGVRKITLLEKKEVICLLDEDDVFNKTYLVEENCSIFTWTLNDRICFWEKPEKKLEDLMSQQGIELEELKYLIFVSQPTDETLEMALLKFSRK